MPNRDDEDFDWHAVDQMGLWEHQGKPLTIRDLVRHVELLDLPIEITVYDGIDASPFLTPLHVDYRGPQESPAAIIITVSLAAS
jgi:hypothetical protein